MVNGIELNVICAVGLLPGYVASNSKPHLYPIRHAYI